MTEAQKPVDAFSLLKGQPGDTARLKRLRFAVIGMGILLAAGFATVIGRIFYLMTRTPPPVDVEAAPLPATGVITATLPAGARALQQSASGSQLSVLYEGPQGQGIVIIDLRTGRESGRVILSPSAR